MNTTENKYDNYKTEEVQDIIDRMPQKTPRIVAGIIIALATILLFLGFLIKYPESISGIVTIRALQPPVRLTATTSGKLHLLAKNKAPLKSGQLIAYIESSTNIEQYLILDSIMLYDPINLTKKKFLESSNLALGELTVPFLKFTSSMDSYRFYEQENSFEPKIGQLKIERESTAKSVDFLKNNLTLLNENKIICAKNLKKDSIQFFHLKSITETKFLQTRSSYLNILRNIQSTKREIESSIDHILELKSRIKQLKIEQHEHEQRLSANLQATYQQLKNHMEQWKQKYAFIAPYSGSLEMLNFWKENTFLRMGEEVFAVIPTKNPVNAQIIIPSHGAGKVYEGQEVIIKLDDYPYLEYGSIEGKVTSISTLANPSDEFSTQSIVDCYQVNVKLPQQLTTNYGTPLSFKHDIKGVAQILVKKRRLIERLFDNLKYIVNE